MIKLEVHQNTAAFGAPSKWVALPENFRSQPFTSASLVRERELLDTSYFRVVFTAPHELNVLGLENQRLFYDPIRNLESWPMCAILDHDSSRRVCQAFSKSDS